MNERLLLDNHSKPARDASNILYEKVKKHGANRHLIYIFDDDFRTAAQGWEIFLSRTDEDRKVRGSLDGILISLLGQIINRKNPRVRQNIIGHNKPSSVLGEKLMRIQLKN